MTTFEDLKAKEYINNFITEKLKNIYVLTYFDYEIKVDNYCLYLKAIDKLRSKVYLYNNFYYFNTYTFLVINLHSLNYLLSKSQEDFNNVLLDLILNSKEYLNYMKTWNDSNVVS